MVGNLRDLAYFGGFWWGFGWFGGKGGVMNPRGGRYPPGIGNGRGQNPNFAGGNPNVHPNYPRNNAQQQYVQRNVVQNQNQPPPQQQQQWLRRNQMVPSSRPPGMLEVEKTVQSEILDSR